MAGVPAKHSSVASTSRSSVDRSQCSPNGVQPMPTIATLSRIPLLATWPRLPEVVVNALGGVKPPEGHRYPGPDVDLVGRGVGHLHRRAAAAVEVDDDVD